MDGSWQGRLLRLARGIEYTFFPILGLVFSEIAIALFQSQGWRTGLLEALRPVFWLLLLYRIIAGALFFILSDQRARRYTGRFLFPLLIWRSSCWSTTSSATRWAWATFRSSTSSACRSRCVRWPRR
ncbi:MAG: hypothetical protein R2854_28315 [Caldilineaceae bacterium]